jgi:hypothetical protein
MNLTGFRFKDNGDIEHREMFFGEKTWLKVCSLDLKLKIAIPSHGYFPPHKTGVKLKKYFDKIGINYLCN